MRYLIALITIVFAVSACKNENNRPEPESEVIWLRAGFRTISKVEGCPGSWIIERDSTGERFSCEWLPSPISTVGKDFFAHCKMTIKPEKLSTCLKDLSPIKQIDVVYVWYN
jgi:hypothetical protein